MIFRKPLVCPLSVFTAPKLSRRRRKDPKSLYRKESIFTVPAWSLNETKCTWSLSIPHNHIQNACEKDWQVRSLSSPQFAFLPFPLGLILHTVTVPGELMSLPVSLLNLNGFCSGCFPKIDFWWIWHSAKQLFYLCGAWQSPYLLMQLS